MKYIKSAKVDSVGRGNISMFESSVDKVDKLWPQFVEYVKKLKEGRN